MTAQRLNELTATEVAHRLARGETTARAVIEACLEQVARREAEVLAFAHLDAEEPAPPPMRWTGAANHRRWPAPVSASRTSSIRRTCRPATARRSIKDTNPLPMLPAWR